MLDVMAKYRISGITIGEKEKLVGIISKQFGKKDESVLRNVMLAFDAGYAFNVGDLEKFSFEPGEASTGRPRISTDGNTMLTLGLLAGGVRFGSAYPITPWSQIMEMMRAELPKYNGIFVQAEDELSAVSMAIGMAYAGHMAMTGSSGPGISLKMEALGYASMAEIPLVVVNVQRGGPSTGMPTNVEQSDLMQAIYGSHGDAPRVVISPKNVEDCFYTAMEACRIAREYSTPVIILTDQAVSTRIEAFDEPDLPNIMVKPGADLSPRPADFKPYPLDRLTRPAPPGSVIGSGKYPTVTGLEHDELGHPTGSSKLHTQMTAKRREKIKQLAATLPAPELSGDSAGEALLVTWGSNWGPGREAISRVRAVGIKAGHLHLRHLNPLPNGLAETFARYHKIVVAEINDQVPYTFGELLPAARIDVDPTPPDKYTPTLASPRRRRRTADSTAAVSSGTTSWARGVAVPGAA
mgnify:CR=1 FL=1